MAYTDVELKDATQIAYADLSEGYIKLCKENPGETTFSILEIVNRTTKIDGFEGNLDSLKTLSPEELENWKIVACHDRNSTNGFYGCVIETGEGEAITAFRGSEDITVYSNMEDDWIDSDMGLLNSVATPQQLEVEIFLETNKSLLEGYDLTMTGHSLGGNLAEYATIVSVEYGLDDNIKNCTSLDGPGFSNEFINMQAEEISKMSPVMTHYRWSGVGTILQDLPGVDYKVVATTKTNPYDDETSNSITRHDTKYLSIDENGNFIDGENDTSMRFLSTFTQGIDHMPAIVGNSLTLLLGGLLIAGNWMSEMMVNENGDGLSAFGIGVIVAAVLLIPLIVPFIATAIIYIAIFLLGTIIYEIIYDSLVWLCNKVCELVGKAIDWAEEKISELVEFVANQLKEMKDFLNNNFNVGYRYATQNPVIKVDTYKLTNYAQRLQNVNKRIKVLDARFDKLYTKSGLLDLFNLIQADLLTGYSWRLERCVAYLNDTANDFEVAERDIMSRLI